MMHHNKTKKLGRKKNVREALIAGLAESVILRGRIKTTEAKAKALRPFVERLVTLAKKDTLASRRMIISRLGSEKRATKLFSDIAPKYKDRNGGYTRIVKLPARGGDASPMAFIEFV